MWVLITTGSFLRSLGVKWSEKTIVGDDFTFEASSTFDTPYRSGALSSSGTETKLLAPNYDEDYNPKLNRYRLAFNHRVSGVGSLPLLCPQLSRPSGVVVLATPPGSLVTEN